MNGPASNRVGRALAIVLPALLAAGSSAAQSGQKPIRIWGHGALGKDYIESLVRKWEAGFTAIYPAVKFDNQLHGTASAIGALYTGTGDIAVMGREIWPVEVEAYKDVMHTPPVGIDVCSGSLDIRNKDFALAVFVPLDNPLKRLSLPQIAALFGAQASPGVPVPRTWGDLGVTGERASHPIHVYGFEIHRGFGYYLQQVAFHGSAIWNPEMVELGDVKQPDGTLYDAGQRIVDAIAKDPDAIGYSSLLYTRSEVRSVPIGPAGGPFLLPTHATIADHSYVLTRNITAFVNSRPGRGPEARVAEFLRYVLSHEGQQAVVEDGGYTPLAPGQARAGLRALGGSKR